MSLPPECLLPIAFGNYERSIETFSSLWKFLDGLLIRNTKRLDLVLRLVCFVLASFIPAFRTFHLAEKYDSHRKFMRLVENLATPFASVFDFTILINSPRRIADLLPYVYLKRQS